MTGPDSSREANPFDAFDEVPTHGQPITVGDILRAGEPEAIRSIHESMAAGLRQYGAASGALGHRFLEVDDPLDLVAQWTRERAGRDLGMAPTCIRFRRADLQRGILFAIHNPHPGGEAELIVVAQPGVLSRGVIRDACRWAFYHLGLWRVVVRIPADRPDLADLARRARFRFEGTARLFFGGVLDAQVWAMTGPGCSWLPPLPSVRPPADAPNPSSLRVH